MTSTTRSRGRSMSGERGRGVTPAKFLMNSGNNSTDGKDTGSMSTRTNGKDAHGYETVPITPEQKRKWEDTMSMMAWVAPGFRHILYKLLNAQNNTDTDAVAIWT